ncbi:hypothetical protein DFH09DRAFT_1340497 [Mycena vulgaris]|nr:hypothetical protein DFH09DRAFT_1340497 [Mycena vulgaris]
MLPKVCVSPPASQSGSPSHYRHWFHILRALKHDVSFPPLLNSNLQSPALKTLRLRGPGRGGGLSISLSAPQLRILDFTHTSPTSWDTLWVPTVENMRLFEAGDAHIGTLGNIFSQCPLLWRVALNSDRSRRYYPDAADAPDALRRRPLAPSLRELELRVGDTGLEQVLKIAVSDVVLDTLTGCIYKGHSEDEPGASWKYLSMHYDLHKTVQVMLITTPWWNDYAATFELSPDGIALTVTQIMTIGGLAKVKFGMDHGSNMEYYRKKSWTLDSIGHVLTRIEPQFACNVEVCIAHAEVKGGDASPLGLPAFHAALTEMPECV